MSLNDWEPLLSDERVGKIAELLRIAFPALGSDAEVFTFVVPEQRVEGPRRTRFPHERGCKYPNGDDWDNYYPDCDCGPYTIPEQAVFAIRTRHPRSWDPVYGDKTLMSQAGMLRSVWEAQEKQHRHYVGPREDPAWSVFVITAQNHLRKTKDYKELI